MTAPARITQDDMNRATKAVARAGFHCARIVMRLEKAEIEVIIGESPPPPAAEEEWTDDD
ncbi:hypothetical protein [Pelagerythrobacter marinus]|jgi:hypothetical protein|uniref:hypothetical protein n=1 Tax=Pelagerythrobacter marinus TaxID=538382 RepID=UPI002037313F|nr:hypothetical protein [Pelagerythrobacter marinus]MEC9067855.1 hypothetical protein [Pseudomonadota bacterium]USA40260.1 hypothetical protein NCF86_03640 [Pelagerythrobacter marinus]WPZ05617.1 hypothetical protein T8T98_09260 [Pelagerythrobacter marinus]